MLAKAAIAGGTAVAAAVDVAAAARPRRSGFDAPPAAAAWAAPGAGIVVPPRPPTGVAAGAGKNEAIAAAAKVAAAISASSAPPGPGGAPAVTQVRPFAQSGPAGGGRGRGRILPAWMQRDPTGGVPQMPKSGGAPSAPTRFAPLPSFKAHLVPPHAVEPQTTSNPAAAAPGAPPAAAAPGAPTGAAFAPFDPSMFGGRGKGPICRSTVKEHNPVRRPCSMEPLPAPGPLNANAAFDPAQFAALAPSPADASRSERARSWNIRRPGGSREVVPR